MFKIAYINAIIIGAILSNNVAADCGGGTSTSVQVTSTTIPSLSATLSGNTVCTSDAQEEHQGNGAASSPLWDYKRGNGHPVDPRTQIGTWELVAGDLVRYTYGTNIFNFSLFDNQDGTYSFCNGSTVVAEVTQIVPSINVGCGFAQ